MSTISQLTEPALRQAADQNGFTRGTKYFHDGKVAKLTVVGSRADAEVRGSSPYWPYSVTLHVVDASLRGGCSCPVGIRGRFCKHCVAAALAWGRFAEESDDPSVAELRFVGAVVERTDTRLPCRGSAVTMTLPPDTDVDRGELLKTMTAAFRISGGFIEYRQMPVFTARLNEAVDQLERYLSVRTASDTIKLCEQNLKRVERTFERVDDSRGDMRPIQQRISDIHFRAVKFARPDPVELAECLFAWEMRSEWETFIDAYVTYAEVLGEPGSRRYRELALAAWNGEDDYAETSSAQLSGTVIDFTLRRLVRRIAIESGAPEQIVDAYRGEAENAYRLRELVRDLESAGRADLALHWAHTGVDRLPAGRADVLLEYLAEQSSREGRFEEALDFAWKGFEDGSSLERYRSLHVYGSLVGRWKQSRRRALNALETLAKGEDLEASRARVAIVDCLVWECAFDEAVEAMNRFGAHTHQVFDLAEACERDRPRMAAELYLSRIDEVLAPANRRAYRDATALLERCKSLAAIAGEPELFESAIERVRADHARKSSFMPMIDHLIPPA